MNESSDLKNFILTEIRSSKVQAEVKRRQHAHILRQYNTQLVDYRMLLLNGRTAKLVFRLISLIRVIIIIHYGNY